MTSHEFTLLRHGQSTANAKGIHQGKIEFPLSQLGRNQVNQLADQWLLQRRQFRGIVASPLMRTKQTAEILAAKLEQTIEYCDLLVERDIGQLGGLTFQEGHDRFPLPETHSPYYRFGIDGESEWLLHLRAGRALQWLMERPPGHYLVVSHGGLINRLLLLVIGAVPQANFQGPGFAHANSAHSKISYDEGRQRWALEYSNEVSHLEGSPHENHAFQFLFVRHAQSEGNVKNLYQGSAEFPLSEMGVQQAIRTAQSVVESGLRFNAIVTSPQSRALETAQCLAKGLNLKLERDARLKEVDNGRLAGKNQEEVAAMFPNWPLTEEHLYQPIAQTGESIWDFYLRAGEFLSDLLERPPGTYLVVSHGGTLNALLYTILGIQHQPNWRSPAIHFGNASLTRLNYAPEDHVWRILYLNSRQHLFDLQG